MAETRCNEDSGFDRPAIETLELTRVLHALSDPVRLGIVQRLAEQGALACRAAAGPDVPKATLSRHFKTLRAAGIVETEKTESGLYHSRVRTACLEQRFPGLLASVLAGADTL
jgi:DNA-binding transcriptional ArsR family regulator